MHISLDSALGRQRRLNSVGESVLQIAPDAAAAYSLRSLTGGDPDVVRVRRESDNTEKDFSGSQIESGEMARWVNEQPTLPLDLRELDTNTGERDGALIEAAAAYSLRKLKEDFTGDVVEVRRNVDGETEGFTADEVTDGTLENFVNASFDEELPLDQATGAAAAYSLRNLSSSYTGDVVEVRRSSDDAVQSFTASEVADGTLEDWVTASFDVVTPTLNNGGFETAGTGGFDYWTETVSGSSTITRDTSEFYSGTASCRFDIDSSNSFTGIRTPVSGGIFNVGTTLTYSIRAKGTSGSKLLIGTAGNDSQNDTLNLTTEWQEHTGTVNPHDADTNVQIKRLDSADATIWIDEVTFTINGKDGFVKTWYDQSGSDNHAVQTTPANQPKIVDSGTLVTDRDGKIALDGKGAQLDLPANEMLSSDGSYSLFSACDIANQTAGSLDFYDLFRFISDGTGGAVTSRKPQVYVRKSDGSLTSSSPTHPDGLVGYGASVVQSVQLMTTISNPSLSTGNNLIYADGGLESSSDDSTSVNTEQTISASNSSLFRSTETSVSHYISEVIYYPSDQSTKRRAIEENIANHYDISLAAFSRDGTVSTWYDQSGNTNDATQTDPTKQPKIVEGGTYLEEVDFDGTQYFETIPSGEVLSDIADTFTVWLGKRKGSGFVSQASSYYDNQSILELRYWVCTIGEEANSLRVGAILNVDTLISLSGVNGVYDGFKNGANVNDTETTASTTAGDFTLGATRLGYQPLVGTIKEFIIYNSDQSDNRTAIEANIGETYGITAIPAANDTVNGFVQTWYNQSGEGNDAVQSAASYQPKIVDSGALVTRNINGTVSPSIKFGASNNMYHGITSLSADGQQSLFFVADNQVTSGNSTRLLEIMSSTEDEGRRRRPLIFKDLNQSIVFSVDSLDGIRVTAANSDQVSAYSSITEQQIIGATHTVYQDGTQVGSATVTLDANPTLSTSHEEQLGNLASNAVGNFYFTEIVYYNSDQSSNRPAIEANIANQYGITLS